MAAKPETLIDFVVRYSRPGAFTRSQVVRASSEAAASEAALAAVSAGGAWYGWTIVDVMTVAEAKERLGVSRG